MIKDPKDHAANERTCLAWIRTVIAIIAFGFLIEKFDIFVSYISHMFGTSIRFNPSISVECISLGLMPVAVVVIIGSTLRFFLYQKVISIEAEHSYGAKWPNLILSFVALSFAAFLVVYMVLQVVKSWYHVNNQLSLKMVPSSRIVDSGSEAGLTRGIFRH